MSTYQLEIDGSGAEAGAERIVKSFDSIKAAADRMEGGVSAAAKKASNSFSSMQSAAKPVSEAAINSLKQLSSVFKSFRAPSDAAVRNTIIFLQGLKSVGTLNLGRVTGLAALLSAISGYRGPSPTAGRNTLAVLNALRFASSFSMPRGMTGMLASLSAFRGPSAAAARNVSALLMALNSFRAGPGMAATVRALERITLAANAARTSLGSLRGAGPSSINIKSNAGAAESGFRSMIKTSGILQTALLRTQTAWNALGGILAGRAIINASNDLIKIHAQLQAATGSATKAGFAFGFLRQFAEKMGLDFRTAAQSFGFFLGSVKGTNLTLEESRQIFVGFSTAARALQLSTADVDGVFRALGQMMSKGKIQAEELRGQLGDRLPGAFVRFAVALKMTKPGELDQALKKGAVSGEKMKQAIIDVANALQVEFAGSADKMSKTVDAAFNRLKNAFTFAAGDLGHSGLNQALISIMDTATKLLQSNTLNTLLSSVGSVFKFLGDHVEAVAAIIGTLALSSTLKWAAGLVGLTGAATSATVATVEATAAATAEGVAATEAAAATTVWGAAWTRLNLILKANVFLLVAGAVVALIMALNKSTTAMEDNAKAIDAVNARMPDAANFSDAYAARLLNLSDSANQVTASLQQMIQEMNEAALRASQEDLKGITLYKNLGIVGGYGINVRSGAGNLPKGPEGYFTGEDLKLLNRMAYKTQTGGVALRGNIPQTKQEFEQLGAAMSMVDTRATGPGGGNFGPLQSALHARFNALISQSRQPGYKGIPYSDWAESIVPGYNKPVGGIEGGAPLTKTKTSHKKSDAELAAEDVASAIDQAMKALGDLEVKARATADTIDGLLSGSFDKFTAAAHVAAQEQEKNFEDQIKGHGKVSELQAQQQAVMGLAGKLKGQGKIDAGVDISSYESAKRAIIGVYEALDALDAARKKDSEVANNVAEMRDSNNIQEQAIALLGDRSKSQADVNKYVEVENQLLGTSLEKRPALRKALEEEIDRREQLKRSLEATNEQRDYENQKLLDTKLAPLFKSGVKQEDIDYYRELLELEQKLRDAGASDVEVQQRINLRSAVLNQARAMKELEDQYEKTKQTAADMADAIVGGFRDGMEAGDSFLKIFKNIFNQLEKIIMDFVLYNPLKQWLTQELTQAISPNASAGPTGVGSPGTGTVNSYSSGNGLIGTLANAVVQASGGIPTTGATTTYNKRGFGYVNGEIAYGGTGGGGYYDPIAPLDANGNVVVTGVQTPGIQPYRPATIPAPQSMNLFTNFTKMMTASAEQTKAVRTFLQTGKGAGAAAGAAVGTIAEAYGIYQLGNKLGAGIAKALGGGFRTQAVVGGVVGGAGAGYKIGSLFGPEGALIGAGIGAVVGGILGFLKKRPEIPSSYGSVVVGQNGVATVGATGIHGNADPRVGQQAAQGGANLFNQFAANYGGYLSPGAYGTFGSRPYNPPGPGNNGVYSFYSALGTGKNGQPLGVMGQDYIYGSDSEVQAFALLKQIRDGLIKGLSDTVMTIAQNTKATTMEALQSDLSVGQAYDDFVKGSFKLTDVASRVRDVNDAFNKLAAQAAVLGLSEEKLAAARDRMMQSLKDDFNYQISQGILQISNPAQAAYNDLVQQYHDAVEEAMAVGGDLAAVEKLYGMKRAELAKQWADIATNGLVSAAKDLYNQLTASQASPLNAATVLANSKGLYTGLIAQFSSGDFSNVDKLATYAQNYLDAARSMYGSSTDYFDIFKQVTSQLNQYGTGTGLPTGTGSEPPALPSLDDMVAEINAQSLEMISAMGIVGQAVVEGSTNIVDAINNLAIALGYRAPVTVVTPPVTVPTGPTTGGTGVGSTGGTGTGGTTVGSGVGWTGGVNSGSGGVIVSGPVSGGSYGGGLRSVLQ